MVRRGDTAPDFALKDEQGRTIRLSDFRGKQSVVLIFYPADETPGCTRQLCAARDDADRYADAGIAVFGVNNATAERHQRFVERHGLKTPLLVDEDAAVARAYGALYPIPLLNVINRTVVGIDRDGIVRYYRRGLPPTSEILAAMAPPAAAPA